MVARLAPLLIALAGCRTPPYDEVSAPAPDLSRETPPDLAAAVDLARDLGAPRDFASPRDLATVDLAVPIVCTATLVGANLVKSSPSCVLVESVTTQQGLLRYPCAGGAASATFGGDTFTGTVIGGQVDLAFQEPFPWSDGCKWETHQTIRGALLSGKLAFVYEENPLKGEMNCVFACRGTADVLVK